MAARMEVTTSPAKPEAGSPVELSLRILGPDGKPVTRFEPMHEKLAHLIVVRDGLDEFAHLHPDVGDDGTLRTSHPFPKGGEYRLFVDYQPAGGSPSLASAALSVGGEAPAAPKLVPNSADDVVDGDLHAKVELTPQSGAVTIRFRFTDQAGQPVANLEPYLGAMGHLVVIKAGSLAYVHAHPVGEAKEAPDGVVAFEAHLSESGVYKAWGQFQHQGRVLTFPVVLQLEAGLSQPGGHQL